MKELRLITLFALAAAASSQGAFPDAATAVEIFLEKIGERYGVPEGAATSEFVEGETPDQALAAVRVAYDYSTEVYFVLFVRDGRRWRVADFDGPINYMPEVGGDEGTVSRTRLAGRTYYTFTCAESSYGSGMGTEYDYFLLYRVADEKLVKAFGGETGAREDYYSRWYGGDDSSAWEYGAYVERTTDFTFDDVDGDGTSELWALTRERPGKDGPWTYVTAVLYAAGDDGNLSPADVDVYHDVLAATASLAAKLVLARDALAEAGDVAAARTLLEEAAALEPAVSEAVEKELKFLERFADDQPEAVRLYYRDGNDERRALIEQHPDSAAAAEAVLQTGTLDELTAFLKNQREHPGWSEAYAYAVREALYEVNFEEGAALDKKGMGVLKEDLKRYLKRTVDAEERGQTLTHLADCYYHLGEFKAAARLYEDSLAAAPQGVFGGYNYLRLGDCAAGANDDGAAIRYYVDCVNLDDWWSGGAADALINYAAIREGSKWRHFLDYLDDRGIYEYLTLEAGYVDGDGDADLVALVQWDDEPCELYYFLRTGDEFRGELLTAGRPSLWLPKVVDVFEAGPALLSCRETVDAEKGRVGYEVFYRYDGGRVREVGRIKVEETRAHEPDFEFKATASFVDAAPPIIVVEGTAKSAETETAFAEEYVWDENAFAFVRAER
jgi:tetratricopeptide (TPR) repeat protein